MPAWGGEVPIWAVEWVLLVVRRGGLRIRVCVPAYSVSLFVSDRGFSTPSTYFKLLYYTYTCKL